MPYKDRQTKLAYLKEWRRKNRGYHAEYYSRRREYFEAYNHSEQNRKAKQLWRLRNKEHLRLIGRAHNLVARAIKSGRLLRQPCHCGHQIVQAHHHDYSKPLEVEWLCSTHHKRLHNKT